MKTKYTFEVECKESGQRRAYGDSHYHFIIIGTVQVEEREARPVNERVAKNFATMLSPRTDGTYFKTAGSPFEPRVTLFTETEPGTFECHKVLPSTH